MPRKETIDAFERGLAVLRLFNCERQRLTIHDVAAHLGQSRAGARRNLLTLEKLGYAVLDGRHFSLTSKVIELGVSFLDSNPICRAAAPILDDLADITGEAASITMLEGVDIRYVLRAQPHKPVRPYIAIGARFPAHLTSSGRVLLAHLHHNRLNEHLRKVELSRWTPATITCEQTLRSMLRRTAEAGWSCVRGEVEESVAGISVPLRGKDRRVLAALNLGSIVERTTDEAIAERYLPAIRAAAMRIEQKVYA